MQLMSGNKFNLDDYNIRFALGQASVNVLWLRRAGFHSSTHISMHSHSGYELHIIPYGSGLVIVNGQTYELSKGMLYLTGPGVYHEQKTVPGIQWRNIALTSRLTAVQAEKEPSVR